MSRPPQLPTLGEFIERANYYGFIPRWCPDPDHPDQHFRYLSRTLYGERDEAVIELPPYDDDERLTMNEVDTLCRRSRGTLRPSDFGL